MRYYICINYFKQKPFGPVVIRQNFKMRTSFGLPKTITSVVFKAYNSPDITVSPLQVMEYPAYYTHCFSDLAVTHLAVIVDSDIETVNINFKIGRFRI